MFQDGDVHRTGWLVVERTGGAGPGHPRGMSKKMIRDRSNHLPEDVLELYDVLNRLRRKVPASDTYTAALDVLRTAIDGVRQLVPPHRGR
jgi:hypothetical protein